MCGFGSQTYKRLNLDEDNQVVLLDGEQSPVYSVAERITTEFCKCEKSHVYFLVD